MENRRYGAAMGEVHQLILRHGVEEARRQAITRHERQVVEAAYQVLSEDEEKLGFTYSGFALTSLPHKPLADLTWKREGHNVTLVLQSGVDRQSNPIGVPYGSYARFILLYLQSEAIRTGSPEVELGRSMRAWLERMGFSIGGTTYKMVNEQARRISACNLTFFADRAGGELVRRGGFVDGYLSVVDVLNDQPTLWQERVVLNAEFYRALREHPIPLAESALRAIGPRSMVLDIYIWLAYRLHALKRDTEISWISLHAQFGAGFKAIRQFKAHFTTCLSLALAAYPDAQVSVQDQGIVLRPSRPAVAKA